MSFELWSDEELFAKRRELLDWYIKLNAGGMRQVVAVLAGLVGIGSLFFGVVDVLERGLTPLSAICILLGMITVYLMRRYDRQVKENLDFLKDINSALARRGHEL
jgi:hypothetical protein